MTTPTLTLQAPTAAYTQIQARSGTTYSSNATGLVANVKSADVVDLMTAGYTIVGPGYGQFHVPMRDGRNSDGSALAAAASSGKFGQTITLGTASYLLSQAANNATVTDVVIFEFTLPASFPSGTSPKVMVNANHVIGAGTLTTHTLAAALYKVNDDGTQGSNLITTTAQATPAAAADIEFDMGASPGLNAGDRVVLSLTMVLTETASSNVTGHINSVRFQ